MREIGLHLRWTGSLQEFIEKSLRFHLPFFQCFLIDKTTGYLINPTAQDCEQFLSERRQHFGNLYVHGSYWVNLAGIYYTGHRALYRELAIARKLEFTHFILHPGSAKGGESKAEGIDMLARSLNILLKKDVMEDITIVLENTAHGNLSIGGDLHDFKLLLEKLDNPEKILFCIDTAHAYSYGYDIASAAGRTEFIDLIASTIGIDKVNLLHLNDTAEKLGSKLDRHQIIGQGNIGLEALKNFMTDERIAHIPVLMELPVMPDDEEQKIVEMVRSW